MIEAKIIADSKNPNGDRITTMVVTFPRFILAELNTHRMFSRNSASSRAIPFKKMVESVKTNPFIPIAWQKDHSGMQGTEYFTTEKSSSVIYPSGKLISEDATKTWLRARDMAVAYASELNQGLGITKQLANRLLEPFMWHTVIITATDWNNFFSLRCPKYSFVNQKDEQTDIFRSRKDWLKEWNAYFKDELNPAPTTEIEWLTVNQGQAEIHMMALAEAMWDAYNESIPEPLVEEMWHIPYMNKIDSSKLKSMKGIDITEEMIKISTAMCARVSYTVVGEEGKPANYENDIKLHDRLSESGHWSPFEHCAKAMNNSEYSGNFKGFEQYRKMFYLENL